MKLHELTQLQKALMEHVPRYPQPNELLWAVLAEAGEVAQAAKGGVEGGEAGEALPAWAWWKRQDKAFNPSPRESLREEAVDLLHFVLIACLIYESPEEVTEFDYWSLAWEQQARTSFERAPEYLAQAVAAVTQQGGVGAVFALVLAMRSLGFAREEVEQAYVEKARTNLERWGAGHVADALLGPRVIDAEYRVVEGAGGGEALVCGPGEAGR